MIFVATQKLSGKVCTPIRYITLFFGVAYLRSVTEIAPPQPFLYVNKSPIWYDFRGGAKAIRYITLYGR